MLTRSQYSPKHKWYYFPKMTTEQVVLLKVSSLFTFVMPLFTGCNRHTILHLMLRDL
jgi:hypothetical protein